jgi:hypothetical protein
MPRSRDVLKKAVLILQATDEDAQIISSAFSTLLVLETAVTGLSARASGLFNTD